MSRRRRRGGEGVAPRVSDKIQLARSENSASSVPSSRLLFLFPSRSVVALDRVLSPALCLPLVALIRTRSFTLPTRRCTFFSDPFLRYSADLNGRLRLSRPRMYANPAPGRRVSLRFSLDSAISSQVSSGKGYSGCPCCRNCCSHNCCTFSNEISGIRSVQIPPNEIHIISTDVSCTL